MVINNRSQNIPKFPLPYELSNGFLMDEEIHNAWSRAIECATILVGEELSTNLNNWSQDFQNAVWSEFLMELKNINTLYLIVKDNFSPTISRKQEPVSTNKYTSNSSDAVLPKYQEQQQSSLMFVNTNNNNNVSNNRDHSSMYGGTNKLPPSGIIEKSHYYERQLMTGSMATTATAMISSPAFGSSFSSQQANVSNPLDSYFTRDSSVTENIHATVITASAATANKSTSLRKRTTRKSIHPSVVFHNENDLLVRGRQAATAAAAKSLKTNNTRSKRNSLTSNEGDPNEDISCPTCKRTFSRWRDYERHRKRTKTHSGERVNCLFCNKSYGRQDSLKRHLDSTCKEFQRAMLNNQ